MQSRCCRPRAIPKPASAAPPSQPGQATDLARPADLSGAPSAADQPRASAVQSSPLNPNLATPVEIDSPPVSEVQSPATPPVEKGTGALSTLEEMLRHDPLGASEDVPRPPMPVGR
jgi:hypothetical protein